MVTISRHVTLPLPTSIGIVFPFIFAIFFISGCAPMAPPTAHQYPQVTTVVLGRSTLPEHTVGTTFVYSDGSWEKVVETNPSFVIWETSRGERLLSSPDFTYRPARWENKNMKGYRFFTPTKYLYSTTQTSVWPLAVGNRTHFDEKSKWGIPGVYEKHAEATWKCSVDETERVQVPAGIFDTWKITCSRYNKMTRAGRAVRWEEKIFHYAPSIGHWVVLEQNYQEARPKVRKELVAILPSLSSLGIDKNAIIGIKEHFQQTLGTAVSGEMNRWTDESKQISFAMTPVATYRLADGTPCRRYEQRLDLGWQSKMYYGIACRGESGLWTVPRK